ncbi:hypothetical protein GPALN_010711 [Globodera pallida]|nr:hypothetical protein GPALN_010711 [Globodera pallida]
MELRVHPMEPFLAPVTLLDEPGGGREAHHAVLVYFDCGACGKENRRTYELTDVGKGSRWGYYGRSLGILAGTELKVSYETVEDVFRGIWTKYNLNRANCQHWTHDFYKRGIKLQKSAGRLETTKGPLTTNRERKQPRAHGSSR